MMQQMGMGQGGGGMGGGQGQRGGVIQVTQQEKAAIDRLKAMGFSEHAAVEAYMVCGKNEEMAANYLFDNPDFGGMGGFGAPQQVQQPAAAQPQQPNVEAPQQSDNQQQQNQPQPPANQDNNASSDDNNESGGASGGDNNASSGN